jgi:hypothetical protein
MNQQAVNILLLFAGSQSSGPPPVTGDQWVDNLGNNFVTNTGLNIVFNPG